MDRDPPLATAVVVPPVSTPLIRSLALHPSDPSTCPLRCHPADVQPTPSHTLELSHSKNRVGRSPASAASCLQRPEPWPAQ